MTKLTKYFIIITLVSAFLLCIQNAKAANDPNIIVNPSAATTAPGSTENFTVTLSYSATGDAQFVTVRVQDVNQDAPILFQSYNFSTPSSNDLSVTVPVDSKLIDYNIVATYFDAGKVVGATTATFNVAGVVPPSGCTTPGQNFETPSSSSPCPTPTPDPVVNPIPDPTPVVTTPVVNPTPTPAPLTKFTEPIATGCYVYNPVTCRLPESSQANTSFAVGRFKFYKNGTIAINFRSVSTVVRTGKLCLTNLSHVKIGSAHCQSFTIQPFYRQNIVMVFNKVKVTSKNRLFSVKLNISAVASAPYGPTPSFSFHKNLGTNKAPKVKTSKKVGR
jgi:hypothetical protein